MLWGIVIAIYLAGVYVTALICGYRDVDMAPGMIVLWPLIVGSFAVFAILAPFVMLGIWAFNAGQALRGR